MTVIPLLAGLVLGFVAGLAFHARLTRSIKRERDELWERLRASAAETDRWRVQALRRAGREP